MSIYFCSSFRIVRSSFILTSIYLDNSSSSFLSNLTLISSSLLVIFSFSRQIVLSVFS